MSSGSPDLLLHAVELYGCIDAETAGKLLGLQPGAAIKRLAAQTARGRLKKFPYLHPRCYWAKRPLGAQALIYAVSLGYRCILAEERIWTPERRDGPATIIVSEGEREALFIDYGAEARNLARKIGDREGLVGLVVPSEAKARAVARYIDGIRYAVFPDLWRLQCAKAPR